MTEGQEWYAKYLQTKTWQEAKNKRWKRLQKKVCELCGFWVLAGQYHHISYRRRGTRNEWKDIRYLHPKCHKRCHYILLFFRLPNTAFFLTVRFYQLRVFYWLKARRG